MLARPGEERVPRWLPALVALALALALALSVAYTFTRSPWWDEGLYADVARQFALHGELRSTVMAPTGTFGALPLPRMDQRAYWTAPLYPVTLGLWFRAFGVSLVAMRALSMVLAGVLVAAWAGTVRALTRSRGPALLAAALIALDSHVLWSASMGRVEPLSSGLAVLGVFAYVRWRERHLSRAVGVAAALVAAGVMAHPLALVEGLGLAAAALLLDRRRLRLAHVALALGVGLLVLTPWALYALQDPDTFRAQWEANSAGRRGGLTQPLYFLATDLRDRYLRHHLTAVHGVTKAWVLGLVVLGGCLVAGAAVPWLRRRPGLQPLLLFAAVAWAALALLDGSRFVQYYYHVFPVYVAVGAVVLYAVAERSARGRVLAVATAALLVAPGVAGVLHRVRQNAYTNDYLPAVAAVRAHAPPGAVVVGGSELAFALGFDGRFVDDMELRRRADVYVQGEMYLTDLDGAWQRRVRAELARDFAPVVHNPRFRVYVRRPAPTAGGAATQADAR